jgi:hypothetical protein
MTLHRPRWRSTTIGLLRKGACSDENRHGDAQKQPPRSAHASSIPATPPGINEKSFPAQNFLRFISKSWHVFRHHKTCGNPPRSHQQFTTFSPPKNHRKHP